MIRTATRVLVTTRWVTDASRPSIRLRTVRQIVAESPWAPAILERDAAGIPRICVGAGAGLEPAGAVEQAVTAWQDGQIAVSWSRSGDELAVVVADVGPVGIDLEVITDRPPPERELALVLRHTQVQMGAPGCDAWCEWTTVEALVKATRCGLIGLISGRLLVTGSSAAGPSGMITSPITLRTSGDQVDEKVGQGPPTALFTVITRRARGGDGDPDSDSQQRWQVRHHHNRSHRLSVVIPDSVHFRGPASHR